MRASFIFVFDPTHVERQTVAEKHMEGGRDSRRETNGRRKRQSQRTISGKKDQVACEDNKKEESSI